MLVVWVADLSSWFEETAWLAWLSGFRDEYTSLFGAIRSKCMAQGIITKDVMHVWGHMSTCMHICIRLHMYVYYTVHTNRPT